MPDTTPHHTHDDAMRDLTNIGWLLTNAEDIGRCDGSEVVRLSDYITSIEAASTRCEPSEAVARLFISKPRWNGKQAAHNAIESALASQQPPTITDEAVQRAFRVVSIRADVMERAIAKSVYRQMESEHGYYTHNDFHRALATITAALADRERLVEENGRLRDIIVEAIPFIGYQASVPDIVRRAEEAVEYGSPTHDTQEDHHE